MLNCRLPANWITAIRTFTPSGPINHAFGRPGGPPSCLSLLLSLLLALAWPGAALAQTLVINTAHHAPRSTPEGTGFQDRIVAEAFRRVGRGVEIRRLPSERALINVNSGVDDGNFARVAGLQARYPNLVMVPEPITRFLFTVFTRDPGLRVEDWGGLASLNVGMVIGWKILEAHITRTRSLTKVADGSALFEMLDRGRIDAAVYDLISGQELIRQDGMAGVSAPGRPLTGQDMYIYLHRRHQALVQPLATALRDMKREGVIRAFEEASLGPGACVLSCPGGQDGPETDHPTKNP